MTALTLASEVRRVSERIPDGQYEGIWGGYTVRFSVNEIDYEAKTVIGIRTQRAECIVTVKDGILYISLPEKA